MQQVKIQSLTREAQFSDVPEDSSVLIVNDSPEQLILMERLLRKAGYRVLTAEDGLQALDLAKRELPDLIISDVRMPHVTGLELCRLVRSDKLLRSVPLLLVSAHEKDTGIFVEGLRAGADDYLEIPFDASRLVAKVARLLERSRLEAGYRDLVEQANDVIFTQDLSGKIVSINAAGAAFFDSDPADIIGQSFASVFGLLGLDLTETGLQTDSNDRRSQEIRHQFNTKSPTGDDRWLELTLSPLRDRSNQMVGLRGVARDITERRRVELALSDSEKRYRLLFESTPQPIWVFDEDTLKFLTVNEAATRSYGYTKDEFLSMTIEDLAIPLPNFGVRSDPRIVTCWEHQTKNGKTIYVETTSHPVIFEGRNGRLVIVNDVTERNLLDQAQQRMHASLEQSAMEWRQTFDAIDFPVLIVDLEGRIRRSNYSAEQILASEKVAGRSVSELGERQPWKKAAELIEVLRRTKTPVSEEVRDETNGKTWSIALFMVGEFGSLGGRGILIAQDITKRTELEASLRQSKLMSVLGAVAAGVAHEVRNPLFALSANLDAFEKRFSDRTDFQRYTDVLRSEIERLTVLMEDLLEYGKPFLSELYAASLEELVTRSIRTCRPAAEAAHVELVNRVAGDLPRIMVDRRRIFTVFINLIENALQHSPVNGVVTVEARQLFDGGQEWIECVVKDVGPGIQEDDLPKIFDPFFTKRRGGTGLGLAIAQKTMEEHGGKLFAYNNPEGGASMVARFPVAAEVSDA